VDILASYEQEDGSPALVAKTVGKSTQVYYTDVQLSAKMIRALANMAGIKGGMDEPPATVFYYFSSARLFFKTVLLASLLFLLIILGALICFIPFIMISLLTKPEFYALFGTGMPVWTSGLFSLAQTFEIAGLFLFVCWVARYALFFVPFFENEQMSVAKIISESVKLTKGKLIRMIGFLFSFIGWILLCFILLPALFVIPFALSSLVEYAKEEQRFKAQTPNFSTEI
jgi:uncharacterized membrane protein